MTDNTIRIAFLQVDPWINWNCSRVPNFHVTPSCPRPGIIVEMIWLLTNYLNLTLDSKKVEIGDEDFSYSEYYTNETDLVSWFFDNSSKRALKWDFTKELYSVGYRKIFDIKAVVNFLELGIIFKN